jgi:hypothetical protein
MKEKIELLWRKNRKLTKKKLKKILRFIAVKIIHR